MTTATQTLGITHIGREGDGIADGADGPVFVPNALPGESFTRREDGGWKLVGDASVDRIPPRCRHFSVCGGCVAQHMAPPLYAGWKQGLLRSAFQVHGIAITQAPLFVVPAGSRRRAVFTAVVSGGDVRLGFHMRRSHDVFDVTECPISTPRIVATLPVLREIARTCARQAGKRPRAITVRLAVADLGGGIDVAVAGGSAELVPDVSMHLARLAQTAGLARLTVEDTAIAVDGAPRLPVAGGGIDLPPGAFFQAVASAEARMTTLVAEGVGKARRVADLFAGVGTVSLPLARSARVDAFDSDSAALAALEAAARNIPGSKPVTVRRRNLFNEPLSPAELADYDAVVLDPPRSGAKAQCEMIAKSKLARVVMVSCNPATLARDCRTLVDAGYSLGAVHGIDQFLWSDHLEAVVVATRAKQT